MREKKIEVKVEIGDLNFTRKKKMRTLKGIITFS